MAADGREVGKLWDADREVGRRDEVATVGSVTGGDDGALVVGRGSIGLFGSTGCGESFPGNEF